MKLSAIESIESIAVVGATGMVGQEFLDLLAEHKIKIPKIKLLASEGSAGEKLDVNGTSVMVEALTPESFRDVEVAFFSVPNDITEKFIPVARRAGCLVVDDSSVFRMDKEVPLIVPQVNGALLRSFMGDLIATPNCSTTPLAMCLKPLQDAFGIERVTVSTYQSVSGAGRDAYEELSKQTASLLNGIDVEPEVFPHQIAFNCLPMIGRLLENGNSEEEEKIVRELRKILNEPKLRVSATAVRVPTFCAHGISANVEFKKDFEDVLSIREMFESFPGLRVLDKPEAHIYPTNTESIGSDLTFVGRIRRDFSVKSGLNFWVISDNLRKGAALNVLETLETLYNYRRMS
jgi:aspartate-semialdehyde dehydrogenase